MKPAQIISIKPTVDKSKVQLVIVDQLITESNNSLTGMFNKSDPRFTTSGKLYHWFTVQATDTIELLPQLKTAIVQCIASGEEVELTEPVQFIINNDAIKIRVVESNIVRKNDLNYLTNKIKKIPGKNGEMDRYLLDDNGFFISRYTELKPMEFLKDKEGNFLKDDKGNMVKGVTHELVKHTNETTDLSKGHFVCEKIVYNGNLEAIATVAGEVIEGSLV